jgi:prolyl 4-hydroxylase
MSPTSDTGGPWRRLRQKIDVRGWTAPPPARLVFESPRVQCIDGFVPATICDWLIASGEPRLRKAKVHDPRTGQHTENASVRNNSVVSYNLTQYDMIMVMLRARVAALAGVTTDDLEPPMLLQYEPGQQFAAHYDYLDPSIPALARDVAENGQRVGTFLLYLNDDYSGGETDFPELDWRFKGRKGDALLFWSAGPDGALDRRTRHAGLAPVSGQKWLLSQWIRRRAPR